MIDDQLSRALKRITDLEEELKKAYAKIRASKSQATEIERCIVRLCQENDEGQALCKKLKIEKEILRGSIDRLLRTREEEHAMIEQEDQKRQEEEEKIQRNLLVAAEETIQQRINLSSAAETIHVLRNENHAMSTLIERLQRDLDEKQKENNELAKDICVGLRNSVLLALPNVTQLTGPDIRHVRVWRSHIRMWDGCWITADSSGIWHCCLVRTHTGVKVWIDKKRPCALSHRYTYDELDRVCMDLGEHFTEVTVDSCDDDVIVGGIIGAVGAGAAVFISGPDPELIRQKSTSTMHIFKCSYRSQPSPNFYVDLVSKPDEFPSVRCRACAMINQPKKMGGYPKKNMCCEP